MGDAQLPAAGAAALAVEGVHVRLGQSDVLRGIDLRLEAGTITALLGPSGAGKSTLFRVVAGELTPRPGRITLDGADVTAEPLWRRARRGLGWVPQTPSVLHDLTVAQNLRAFERAARVAPRPPAERATALGLEERLTLPARLLSGGERRRLELLRALVAGPRVLVLDEPLTGLDPASIGLLGALLRAQAAAGVAVLIADHRADDVLALADRAALLVDGRIETQGEAAGFADLPAVRRRYLA